MLKKLLISTTLMMILFFVSPAFAHDPLMLLPEQKTPEEGPLLPDGTISFALYGSLLEAEDKRAFQFRLEPDDRLDLSLLIPNLEPENQMPQETLPQLFLSRPDGSVLIGVSDLYIPFDEPFSMTRYVRIFEHVEQSSGGLYQVEITGSDPARFTVAIGFIERFGTPVENVPNRDAGRSGIFDWYENPVSEKPMVPPEEEPVEKDVQEATPVTKAPVVEETSEPPEGEPVEKDAQEATPVTKAPVIEETSEPPEGEPVEKDTQEATHDTREEADSSSKIFIPLILGLLLIYPLVKILKNKKSSIQVSDQ
ncbi:MAG: hypothetical protein VYB07_03160 [Actinomycetota bacterium]|nr:hypothetical protein [Actinomycetota bacterium]